MGMTMGTKAFHYVISTLMSQLGIEGYEAELKEEEDTYTVTIEDKYSLHLVGAQQGLLHIWSFPGKLPADVSRETLIVLLAVNGVTFDYPSLHVGLDHKSGELMLWARHPLAELDSVTIRELFDLFVDLTERLQQWILAGASLPLFASTTEGVQNVAQTV
jgi:hypothetical protein